MQPQTNVVPFKPATRPKRLSAPKATRLTTACYKACDNDHSTVDWYTPPTIVEALGGREGFDLDPCTPEDPSRLPAPTARRMIPSSQDGLTTPWCPRAFVWLNPPYGKGMDKWMDKLANHPGGGVALVPAHMDPGMDARVRAQPPQHHRDPPHPWPPKVHASRWKHWHCGADRIGIRRLRPEGCPQPQASAGKRCAAREVPCHPAGGEGGLRRWQQRERMTLEEITSTCYTCHGCLLRSNLQLIQWLCSCGSACNGCNG